MAEIWKPTRYLLFLLTVLVGQSAPRPPHGPIPAYPMRPLRFEVNVGQADPQVKYLARSQGQTVFFSSREVLFSGSSADGSSAIHMTFANSTPQVIVEGLDALPGRTNYFSGSDLSGWRTNIPEFARVRYRGLYPGVDLIFYGTGDHLEYDLILAAGVDPGELRLHFENASVRLNDDGDLLLHTANGDLHQRRPAIYQTMHGTRMAVDGGYAISETGAVTFRVGVHDPSLPLVLDPELTYSSYLGGSDNDEGKAIAVDAAGNVYVAGFAGSLNFPTTSGTVQPQVPGRYGAFVTKFDGSTGAPIYSTYIASDGAWGIAVDFDGSAVVVGYGGSNFPLVNPIARTGGISIFKLNPSGSALTYSTLLGGSAAENAYAVALDRSGAAYVTGQTSSRDFLLRNPIVGQLTGSNNGYVLKVSADGSELVYSTYLGGTATTSDSGGKAIAVDSEGCAYVAGITSSRDFPAIPLRPGAAAGGGSYVLKLNPEGTKRVYSVYVKEIVERVTSIAVDAAGQVTLAGMYSVIAPGGDPKQPNPYWISHIVVARLNASGDQVLFSTNLAGDSNDSAYGLAVDASGFIWVAGNTMSRKFPMAGGVPREFDFHIVVARLSPEGTHVSAIVFGGGDWDDANGIAVDNRGNAWVTGYTLSTDFPVVRAFQPTYGGAGHMSNLTGDAFVARISDPVPATALPQIRSGGIVIHGGVTPAASPGSLVDIYGSNLAMAEATSQAGPILPRTLGGVQVVVNGIAAPLLYVGPGQIVCQIPYETVLGTATVEVVSGNSTTKASLTVQQAAPSLLMYGDNRAMVVNPDNRLNASGNGAKPGSVVVAYLVGSGPLNNRIATGAAAPLSPLLEETLVTSVSVGGSTAAVQFAGMTPGLVGLVQVNFVVPDVPPGDYPIQVAIGDFTSNPLRMTVSQ